MERKTLYFPATKAEKNKLEEVVLVDEDKFQYAPMWFVFDVKPISLKAKARLVIGGHVVETGDTDTFSYMMSTEGARILAVIADHMGYNLAVGDINTAYLYATTKERIYSRADDEAFIVTGYAKQKRALCLIHKAQYGLPGSGHAWWLKLGETLRDLNFQRSRGDPEIWI